MRCMEFSERALEAAHTAWIATADKDQGTKDDTRDMVAAVYPIIREDVIREVADWLDHGAPIAAKWVREEYGLL